MRTAVCFSRVIPLVPCLAWLLCAHPAFGQCTLVTTGPLPAGPLAYIPNHDNNSVSMIQLAVVGFPCFTLSPTVLATNRQGAGPVAVAAAAFGAAVYVANYSNSASTTDPFAVVSPILFGAGGAIPVGSGQIGIALNPVLPYVYAVNQGGQFYHLTAINTNLLIPGSPPPTAALSTIGTDIAPTSVAVTSDGANAWVTHSGSNRVLVLALPPGGGTVSSIDVGNRTCGVTILTAAAAAASIPPAAYVTVPAANAVLVIDPVAYMVVGSIPVGNSPCDIATNAAGTVAYVANYGGSTVSVIDTATGTVTGSLAVGFNPISVKYDIPTGEVVVLNASGTVSIFSAATGILLGQVRNPNYNVVTASSSLRPLVSSQGASGSGAGIGMDTGRGGDGGGEPVLYYSKLDGSLASFGLYTSVKKTSVPAGYFMFPAPTEREFAYDPINQIFWYSTYDGANDQIRAVDPKTGVQWPVVITNLGCVDEAKATNCTNPTNQWDRHVFIDVAGKRLMTPNADSSVSLYDLKSGALAGKIPSSFFPDGVPPNPYLRHFAYDARTGNVWYGFTDGSFHEMTTLPAIAFTGRVIQSTDQIGGRQTNRRHFVIDPKRNQLIYETSSSPGIGLASIDLKTLKGADYVMTADVFQNQAAEEPYLTISMVNTPQCRLNLTVQPQGSGQVVTNPAASPGGYYDCNAGMTVTALPNANFQFASFAGDLTGGNATQTVTLTTDRNVTATFTSAPPVTVNVSAASSTLGPGQSVQLKANVTNSWKKTVTWSIPPGRATWTSTGSIPHPARLLRHRTPWSRPRAPWTSPRSAC